MTLIFHEIFMKLANTRHNNCLWQWNGRCMMKYVCVALTLFGYSTSSYICPFLSFPLMLWGMRREKTYIIKLTWIVVLKRDNNLEIWTSAHNLFMLILSNSVNTGGRLTASCITLLSRFVHIFAKQRGLKV